MKKYEIILKIDGKPKWITMEGEDKFEIKKAVKRFFPTAEIKNVKLIINPKINDYEVQSLFDRRWRNSKTRHA